MANRHDKIELSPELSKKQGLTVRVDNNNIEAAIRTLKKRLTNEGVIKEIRKKEYYEKPSARRRRERAEAKIRARRKTQKDQQVF